MIRQLTGTIVYTNENAVVIDVHGVGYEIHVSVPTEQMMLGNEVCFFTHLAVRENALDLYGFLDRDTLEIFELLIDLPKIGPKSAVQILRQADTALLRQAVASDDAGLLSKMSGIGKKSAEKIVAGLKDKFDDTLNDTYLVGADEVTTLYVRDTIDALISLGYPESDARKVVRQLSETNPEIITSPAALKAALKTLSN